MKILFDFEFQSFSDKKKMAFFSAALEIEGPEKLCLDGTAEGCTILPAGQALKEAMSPLPRPSIISVLEGMWRRVMWKKRFCVASSCQECFGHIKLFFLHHAHKEDAKGQPCPL